MKFFFSWIFVAWCTLLYGQYLPAPTGLSVEYLRAPDAAVITDDSPLSAWVFPRSGMDQSAYRILVASAPHLLKEGEADLWDSGQVSDPGSINIPYGGKPLHAENTYWWLVKVWSAGGLESAYSPPQVFHTGGFDRGGLDYPGQSRWIELAAGDWVSEDKQRATFHYQDPVEINPPAGDSLFVAFEKSAIGILAFTATSESEDVPLTIHMGERKNEDQTVHKVPGLSNIGYAQVEVVLKKGTHRYIARLPEREISGYLHTQKLGPHYPEVMPFRYVEIRGDFKRVRVTDIQQGALFYYFDDSASRFSSSNEDLNAVWDLCKYTLKATPFLGVYADGNRERMPYEADAYIQQMSHFAVDREFSIARYTINFLLDHGSWPTEWHMHMVLMAWNYYMHTGDDQLLRERYEDLKRKSLIALTDDNGLISTRTGKKTEAFLRALNFPGRVEQFRDIVDWPQGPPPGEEPAANQSPVPGGETDGFVFTDYNAVVNAFHYRCLVLMGKIAEIVGNEGDRAWFEERSAAHRAAYMKAFFDPEKGVFTDGITTGHASLHANMFPLAFGLVPKEDVAGVADFIKSRGMACSVYGSQYLLDALYAAGEADYALELMTDDGKRSWLNMIRVGSSMTTEAWDEYFKPNLTWNHAWGAAPANITARKLMGIEPIEPAFEVIRIAPQPGGLKRASVQVPTLRGAIHSELEQLGGTWRMEISVPGNSRAELWLPARFDEVRINGLAANPNRQEMFAGDMRTVFALRSGNYTVIAEQ